MEDVVQNLIVTEPAADTDLLADIELLSEAELAKVGGRQGIFLL